MSYVNYNYYTNNFYGTLIPETNFNKKALEASSKVKYFTSNKIDRNNISDDIKNATCTIAELLYKQEKMKDSITNQIDENKKIASETLGPRSITYSDNTQEISKMILSDSDLNKKILQICREYLSNTELMYRGFYG